MPRPSFTTPDSSAQRSALAHRFKDLENLDPCRQEALEMLEGVITTQLQQEAKASLHTRSAEMETNDVALSRSIKAADAAAALALAKEGDQNTPVHPQARAEHQAEQLAALWNPPRVPDPDASTTSWVGSQAAASGRLM